jgi:hypothetical protein
LLRAPGSTRYFCFAEDGGGRIKSGHGDQWLGQGSLPAPRGSQENAKIERDLAVCEPIFRGDPSMSKPWALTLFCCLAALPLIGCANGDGPQSQACPGRAPVAADTGGARVYAAAPGAPAAVLVMLPDSADVLTADPALWAAQGFDVVTPPPSEIYQLAADREAALRQLIASAQAMADAPVWLIGPNPAIAAAIAGSPMAGPGQISGMVVTSVASSTGSCSERINYSSTGNGAAPKVTVSKSGNACAAGSYSGPWRNPAAVPAAPAMPPGATPLTEASASAVDGPSSRQGAVHRIADLIKAAPSS